MMIKDLPYSIRGLTVTDGEHYSIIVNAHYNAEQQRKTVKHEEAHIKDDDFFSCETADEIEKKKHD